MRWRGIVGLLTLLVTLPAVAESDNNDDRRFRLGIATWLSQGRTTFAHDSSAGDPLLGNPTSTLRYDGIDSTVLELEAEARLFWRLSLSARVGSGSISGGELFDSDFLSAQGAQFYMTSVMGAHRFSHTRSEVDREDVSYIEVGLARHLLPKKKMRRGYLKLYASARFWDESLLATGLEQLECTTPLLCLPVGPPLPGFVDVPVIGEDSDWLLGLVGIEGEWRSKNRFEWSGRLGIGLSDVETDDIHFQRTDLAQDPSFRWVGDGSAFELELRGFYRLSQRFRLGLGYRLWDARADQGTLVQFGADGSIAGAPLLEYEAHRDGWLLVLEHRTVR